MKKRKKKIPSKEKIREYLSYIKGIQEYFKDLSDGAFFAVMQSETENWLNENGFSHLDPYDFYIKYS